MSVARIWLGVTLIISACGSDETIERPAVPDDTSTTPALDLCSAMWALVTTPGISERLCALQVDRASAPDAPGQCKLCAASLVFFTQLMPNPSCATVVDDCPVPASELDDCFATLGQLLSEGAPRCAPDGAEPASDPAQLALRIAGSSCGPVLTRCQPLQELVSGLVGTALGAP